MNNVVNNIEFPLLTKDQINVKVKQVTAKGAIALLYKDARVDMDMLDSVVGQGKWECDYKEIKGNLFCGIGIEIGAKKLATTNNGIEISERIVVWKWDCGVESAQTDGNEKKAEASDAFKRAGFRWGIGRELYTAPFTFLKVATKAKGNGFELENKFARYEVSEIEYTDRRISHLVIVDASDNTEVFRFGKAKTDFLDKKMNMPMATEEQQEEIMNIFPPERVIKMLNTYNIANVRELTRAQAAMIINKRKKEIEKEESDAINETQAAMNEFRRG